MNARKVSDYMTRSLHSLGPDHSLIAAHRLMQRHNVRHLPVLDEKGRLLGIVSQRDLYFVESLTDAKADELIVAEAMSMDVTTTSPDAPVSEVARTMAQSRLGSVVVVDDKDGENVVGIFTTIDALRALMEVTEAESTESESTGLGGETQPRH